MKTDSFDFFDTVLMRVLGSPSMVFLLLGKRLNNMSLIQQTPEAFARARINAHRRASKNAGGSDSKITLRQIYAELGTTLGLTEKQQDQLINLECALEEELIRPVRGAKDHIEADCVCSQHNVQAPRGNGLRVEPFFEANLNRYEQILDAHAWATEGLSSAIAGASRLARLSSSAATPKQQALRDIAASVVAPTLVGYVLWVLHRAQKLGLSRLYFIARDGQILLGIARRLARKLNMACELRYLYGSRRAWLLPAMTSIDEEQLSLLQDYSATPSVRNLLSRLEIVPEQISQSLSSIGLPEECWSRHLSQGERASLYSLFKEDERLHKLILERAAAKRPVLLEYLQQEGLLDPIAWGMVDVGWKGRPQNALGRLLAAEGGAPPVSFSFGVRKGSRINRHFVQQEVYFFNEALGLGFVDLLPRKGLVGLVEVFCSADHGQVIGFEIKDKRVVPILTEDHNRQLLDCGLPLLQETVYRVAEHLLLDASLLNVEADLRDAIAEVLRTFWLRPSGADVQALADFPCEAGVSEDTRLIRLAEGYRWKHVVKSLSAGQLRHDHLIIWDAGAQVMTPPHIRFALQIAVRLSRACRRSLRPIKRAMGFPA